MGPPYPIILRPVDWDDQPFSKFKILPNGARPLKRWSDIDEGYLDIYISIKSVVFDILSELYLNEADEFEGDKRLDEALALLDEAKFLGLPSAHIRWRRGNVLFSRGRYEEALAAYDETILLDSTIVNSYFYQCKAHALRNLNRFEEALSTYNEAIRLGEPDPDPILYKYKGMMYEQLARQAYSKAKQFSQTFEVR